MRGGKAWGAEEGGKNAAPAPVEMSRGDGKGASGHGKVWQGQGPDTNSCLRPPLSFAPPPKDSPPHPSHSFSHPRHPALSIFPITAPASGTSG